MATMKDVARLAGVSPTTVSFVLSGNLRADGSIGEETRQRVLDVAEQLRYKPNRVAKAMISGQTKMLALFLSRTSAETNLRVLGGAFTAANELGYVLKIEQLSGAALTAEAVERSFEWRVAGALAIDLDAPSLELLAREYQRHELPFAYADTAVSVPSGFRVCSDDDAGIREVVDYLFALGHRRFAFSGGSTDSPISQLRAASFRTKMRELGLTLPEQNVVASPWGNVAANDEAARHLLTQTERPTAIVCAGDTLAMSVVRVARELGLDIPGQLSVTGYGNNPLAAWCAPALSSVEQPFDEMGHRCVEYLVQAAEASVSNDESALLQPVNLLLSTRWMPRASTAPPP